MTSPKINKKKYIIEKRINWTDIKKIDNTKKEFRVILLIAGELEIPVFYGSRKKCIEYIKSIKKKELKGIKK